MDFPHSPPAPASPLWRGVGLGAAVLALALFALVLARNEVAVAGGSDSSGYMNHARLLASGRVHVEPRTVPGLVETGPSAFLYSPLGFKPAPNGQGLVPTYPAGFSLLVLALEPVAGWRLAGDLVMVLHAVAGLVLTFALGRALGLDCIWAALGAAIVATSPLYLFMSAQAMSDVPSLAWTTAAVLAALKSRERTAWALAAGAAFALDVLLRPTNMLALLPIAVALGGAPKRWGLFILAGMPGAAFFLAHSRAAYGNFLATGYGDTYADFGGAYVRESLMQYAVWLPLLLTPVAAFCLGIPWARSTAARTRWLLSVWILAFAAFYSAYRFTHETWWYLRFLLPAVPAMVVGALLVVRSICGAGSAAARLRLALASSAALVAANATWSNHLLRPLLAASIERRYEEMTDWMVKNLPTDAVVLSKQATGAIFYYTGFTFIRWDFVDATNVARIESAIRDSKRPLYAVLFPFEYNDLRALDRMPGRWIRVDKVKDIVILRRDFAPSKS